MCQCKYHGCIKKEDSHLINQCKNIPWFSTFADALGKKRKVNVVQKTLTKKL